MALTLGPLVISLPRLFLLLGVLTAWLLAWRTERREGVYTEGLLWLTLVIGLVAARAGYVAMHLDYFGANPLDIFKVWQGGFLPAAGAIAALLAAIAIARWRKLDLKLLLLPVIAALVVWGGLSFIAEALERGRHQSVPELAVQNLQGEPVSLADFQGQPLVVNVWATWCPPCRREMPALAAAAENNPDVAFVFLNQGEGRETVSGFLSQQKLSLSNVLLDIFSRSAEALGTRGLPTTLFFNAEGQLVDTHVGEITTPQLQDRLRRFETPK